MNIYHQQTEKFTNTKRNMPAYRGLFIDFVEGGQNSEDENRNEIFWNTTCYIEINNLFSPKTITKFNFYGETNEDDLKTNNKVVFVIILFHFIF